MSESFEVSLGKIGQDVRKFSKESIDEAMELAGDMADQTKAGYTADAAVSLAVRGMGKIVKDGARTANIMMQAIAALGAIDVGKPDDENNGGG